ncbi:unnamed protein product, partial [Mesorhabditis spiculigera]
MPKGKKKDNATQSHPIAKPQEQQDAESQVVESGSETKKPDPAAVATQEANMRTMLELATQLAMAEQGSVRNMDAARNHQFNFWNTQPVPKFDEKVEENTFIEPDQEPSLIRSEPFSLPQPFEWSDVDLEDPAQLKELYSLLSDNYVEDDDNMFRFDYSSDFLKWALQIPGWLPQWHCGVRAASSKKLVAFISAIPQAVRIYDKTKKMVEINFLCVHKKLRQKRVAPVLIREITRRVNQQGIFQAAFTAGVVLPKPVSVCRYYHRSLNPKKLIDCRFSALSSKMTMLRTVKLYKVPDETKTVGLRPLEKKDLEQAMNLLNTHLNGYSLVPVFEPTDFEHIFMPRDNVIYTYVVETGGKITDMFSFYSLPSSVMNHPTHKRIEAAYAYYTVANTVSLKQLMLDALVVARKAGFDVFNALDLMQNREFFEDLKFGIGDGNLQYYLYNWKCPDIDPSKIGLILQ